VYKRQVISDIPLVDKLDHDPVETIKNGVLVRIDADEGIVELVD